MKTLLSNINDLARVIDALPSDGPLPTRTVIVRSEAVAHVLRRDLAALRSGRGLIGTRFIDLRSVATQVLEAADVAFTDGEERLRPARVRAALRTARLTYFTDVRGVNGWDAAFARTIDDLEAAALLPEDVERVEEPRAHDVAAIWRIVRDDAKTSWTRSRLLLEAATVLDDDPTRWPERGVTLVVLDGHETHAEAALVGRVPRARHVLSFAKPLRQAHINRIRLLFGDEPADLLVEGAEQAVKPSATDERSILSTYFFEPPAVLASTHRTRSAGRDGSVDFEEYAGVDEEIDAAVDWVAREVERRTPLEEIALVVPHIDPFASLLVSRLRSLPWMNGDVPVHVMSGLPLSSSSAGARVTMLLRLLQVHLHIDAMIDFLPSVRLADGRRIARGAAVEILSALGTIGGSTLFPTQALEWTIHLERQREKLRAVVASDRADDARDAERRKRRLLALDRVAPVISALCALMHAVIAQRGLKAIWGDVRAFISEHLPLPGDAGRTTFASLDALIAEVGPTAESIKGAEAIAWLEERVAALRHRIGRFGEPKITIATVAQAASLRFRAVRVMGLAEGVLPRSPRENPVLSDRMRGEWLELRRAHEKTLAEVQSLARVVSATSERIVLSHARKSLEGSYREPSPVFVEGAAALGRHGLKPFPDGQALARAYFEPARTCQTPVVRAAQLLRLGAQGRVARAWHAGDVIDPSRIRAASLAPVHAPLAIPATLVPGLTAQRPTSASRLGMLLRCGHLFLLNAVLGFYAPARRANEGTIDTLAYGDLFHRTAEAFYRVHGSSFVARTETLDAWILRADGVVDRLFQEFLEIYPLRGGAVRAAQQARLRRDVHALLEHDWESEASEFVEVERAFGVPTPLELGTKGGPLFVRGYIDRLDRAGPKTRVWDLKSGNPHPREKGEIEMGRDVQLALYARVVERLASDWDLPASSIAAYVYPSAQVARERAFHDDIDVLLARLDEWLDVGVEMLSTGTFPRTTAAKDCDFCDFQKVCGADAAKKSASQLEQATGASLRFRLLKEAK